MTKCASKDDEEWCRLEIKFLFQVNKFVDNKIYGIVEVKPETCRKLIEKFELLVDDAPVTSFSAQFRTISAVGFNPKRRNWTIAIVAVPKDMNIREKKVSERQSFCFRDHVFGLCPTITFDESVTEDQALKTVTMVIEWDHVSDDKAQKYIIYQDGKAIKRIHERHIHDRMKVSVENIIPNAEMKHTLQIVSTLANGKEICRSDLMEFTVELPGQSSICYAHGVINVFNESMPLDYPIKPINGSTLTIRSEQSKSTTRPPSLKPEAQQAHSPANDLLARLTKQIEDRAARLPTWCPDPPHQVYPGEAHYFRRELKASKFSSIVAKTTDD